MHAKFERLLSKSLTTLEVMAYYLVVHAGPGFHSTFPPLTLLLLLQGERGMEKEERQQDRQTDSKTDRQTDS